VRLALALLLRRAVKALLARFDRMAGLVAHVERIRDAR
jgi:hypothetical protein